MSETEVPTCWFPTITVYPTDDDSGRWAIPAPPQERTVTT